MKARTNTKNRLKQNQIQLEKRLQYLLFRLFHFLCQGHSVDCLLHHVNLYSTTNDHVSACTHSVHTHTTPDRTIIDEQLFTCCCRRRHHRRRWFIAWTVLMNQRQSSYNMCQSRFPISPNLYTNCVWCVPSQASLDAATRSWTDSVRTWRDAIFTSPTQARTLNQSSFEYHYMIIVVVIVLAADSNLELCDKHDVCLPVCLEHYTATAVTVAAAAGPNACWMRVYMLTEPTSLV